MKNTLLVHLKRRPLVLLVIPIPVLLCTGYFLYQLGETNTVHTKVLPHSAGTFGYEKQQDLFLWKTGKQQTFGSPNVGLDGKDDTLLYIDPPESLSHTQMTQEDNWGDTQDLEDNEQDLVIANDETWFLSEKDQEQNKESNQLPWKPDFGGKVTNSLKKEKTDIKIDSPMAEEPIGILDHVDRNLSNGYSQLHHIHGRENENKTSGDIQRQKLSQEWMELRNMRKENSLTPADADQWEGLHFSEVELRYPGIRFSRDYSLHMLHDFDLEGEVVKGTAHKTIYLGQIEDRFYQQLATTHIVCKDVRRLGSSGDGGWDICFSEPYTLHHGCLAYSFGIGYDFSFDDSLAETFNCEVRAFDPSMQFGDHMHLPTVYFYQLGLGAKKTVNKLGWKLDSFTGIMQKLSHLNSTIDILKIDIEYNEWSCLPNVLTEDALRNVKQLALEIHTPEVSVVNRASTWKDFYTMYKLLHGLETRGFRKFHYTPNPIGKYKSQATGEERSCCFELYFVNIHFLKT